MFASEVQNTDGQQIWKSFSYTVVSWDTFSHSWADPSLHSGCLQLAPVRAVAPAVSQACLCLGRDPGPAGRAVTLGSPWPFP